MDRLTLHIEYLLLRHDCVVIPGFGAFINVRHSAFANAGSGLFHPMSMEVRFNAALSHDDGLLASSFARKERVSFAEGREMVTASASQLRCQLLLDREVSIGRLGSLRVDEEDNISFHPCSTPEHTASQLGWMPASMSVPAVTSELPDGTEEANGTVADSVTPAGIGKTDAGRRFDTDRNYYIPVNKIFARSAASLILLAVIAVSIIMPFSRNYNEDQASVLPVKAITEAVAPAKPTKPEVKEVQIPCNSEADQAVPEVKGWHLIVATFRTAEDAANYIAANTGCGYTLTTVASRRLYRVSAQDATEKRPLLERLNTQEFRKSFPEAWIYNSESK